MTNEEIEAKASFLADGLNLPHTGELGERAYLANTLRMLVSQAYAEAVTLAETYDLTVASQSRDQRSAACIAAEQIATRIRALKDSLVPAKPAST